MCSVARERVCVQSECVCRDTANLYVRARETLLQEVEIPEKIEMPPLPAVCVNQTFTPVGPMRGGATSGPQEGVSEKGLHGANAEEILPLIPGGTAQ